MTPPNIEELIAALTQTNQLHEDADICTADIINVLQSQAERIKELEGDVEYLQKDINAMCNAIPNYHWSGGAAALIAECFAERDALRAQRAKELPELPEPDVYEYDIGTAMNVLKAHSQDQLQAYGAACAAHARDVALSDAKREAVKRHSAGEVGAVLISKAIEQLKEGK